MKNVKGFTLAELVMLIWFLIVLSLAGAAIWAVCHFIAKFW